jgi:cardiolipin synthase
LAWARSGRIGDLGLVWHRAGREPGVPAAGGCKVRVIRSAPGRPYVYHTQLEAARRAQRYIYLENAYFADDALLYELCRARKRGVDVRVIMPEEPNHKLMRHSNKVAARTLLEHGVRVYKYPGMSHIKAAVFDGWACVGTANYDKLSLLVNREITLAFSDRATVDRLQKDLFQPDFQAAEELFDPEPLDLADHLWELVADEV